MKKFIATVCIIGSLLAVGACSTGKSMDSGAGYASDTAGSRDASPARSERTFTRAQSK